MNPEDESVNQFQDEACEGRCERCGTRAHQVRFINGGMYCLCCVPYSMAECREIRGDERLHDGR